MENILYVCTWNTCRSPIAEYLTKQFSKQLWKELTVSSAWLNADWSPISPNSLKVLEDQWIDAKSHMSQQINQELVSNFDIIVTMTQKHKDTILTTFDVSETKVATLAEVSWWSWDVEDPYELDLKKYKQTEQQIKTYVSKFLSAI